MSKLFLIRWTCPHCGHKHKWKWPKCDYAIAYWPPMGTWMRCDACSRESHMIPDAPDDWRWDGDWRMA